MKKHFLLLAFLLPTLPLVSCNQEEKEVRKLNKGFRLPPGDAVRGEVAFTELKCNRCHSVNGIDLPEAKEKSAVHFALGGEVKKVKSYGELVTAIIQPEHVVSPDYLATLTKEKAKDAKSPMPDLNAQMTVRQMSDLVTFLRVHYKKSVPEYYDDPHFVY